MKHGIFRILSCVIVCLLCGLFSAFNIVGSPAPVNRTGLSNIAVKQIDSCLLIYGINTTDNSFVVDLYDPQLKLIQQFNEKITGFTALSADLQYSSDLRFEFVVNDQKNQKQKFIFLDKELKPDYRSESSLKPTLLVSNQVRILDKFRIDDFAWEIRTETIEISWSGRSTVTSLYQYGIKLLPACPFYEVNRAIVLDSSAVEYAKVFLVRDNKIYVYVNQSTASGKQFIYCINGLDGKLIYQTQMVASFNDFLLEDKNWNITKFPNSDAAIFSNYYWDEKNKCLIVGGTWFLESQSRTGTFLLQLDENGAITASSVDYDYWYETPRPAGQAVDFHAFARNKNTCYRIKDMGYQGDGTFSVMCEAYAKVNLFKSGSGVYTKDDFHHYFSIEAYYFYLKPGSIKRKCEGYPVRVSPWANNHRLDSISGYVQGKTRMGDRQFPNDVNILCDSEQDGYFRSVIRGPGKNATKVLTCEPVVTGGTNETMVYFAKQAFSFNNSNRIAFVEPIPLRQQSFIQRNEYYPIDASRIYCITFTVDGYNLKVIGW